MSAISNNFTINPSPRPMDIVAQSTSSIPHSQADISNSEPMDIVLAASSSPLEALKAPRGPGRPKGSKNRSSSDKPHVEKKKGPVGRPRGSGPKQQETARLQAQFKERKQEMQLKKLQPVCCHLVICYATLAKIIGQLVQMASGSGIQADSRPGTNEGNTSTSGKWFQTKQLDH